MTTSPRPWTELLGNVYTDGNNKYGPKTNEVLSAFESFKNTRWLKQVGEPLDAANGSVVHVASWEEAAIIFARREGTGYGPNGHLIEPVERVKGLLHDPIKNRNWECARADAVNFASYSGAIPLWMEEKQLPLTTSGRTYDEAVGEYIYEFVSWLLAEIIGGDAVRSYFREQLAWFHAGHFPCGWEGSWPQGRMRVY